MKYDLIVVGGGPGGLMAAKTAAEDGMKVILVERKRNPTEIHRYCAQIFYLRKLSASKAGLHGDGYIEPVSVELGPDKTIFHFPGPGFSLDYTGPLKPYYNWIEVSPSKYTIYKRRDAIWAFFYQKEAFLAGLLSSAQKAGAEIRPETIGVAAENTPGGVKVQVRGKAGEQTLEASRAIAADGIRSAIVESLGLNKKRQIISPPRQRRGGLICYEMEGIETGFSPFSWVKPCVPSINPILSVGIGLLEGHKNHMSSASEEDLQKFMKLPSFAPWFRHARLVRKVATSAGTGLRTPIKEPVEGNVVVVGDAGAPAETWIQGAVASAYMAVKAIEKELSGQNGYQEYIDWWQKAFYFHNPDYFRMAFKWMAMAGTFTCDEDVDYAYKLLQDKEGVPAVLIAQNIELFKEERPEFYKRFKKVFGEVEGIVSKLGS